MADKKELPLALLEVFKNHTDEEHILTTKQLTSILENEYDLTLERRTLYANVELLKKYGYDISTWQENGYGYYLNEHQFKKSEVLMLCNAIHSSNFISSKESDALIKKLLTTLSISQKHEYTDQVYMPNQKKTANDKLMDTISTISTAIRDRNAITFTYLQYNENKRLVARREKPYTVEPRFIVYRDSKAYLICTSDHYEGFAHYRIDRIVSPTILTDVKIPPLPKGKTTDAYEYSKNMYYMFNDEIINAIIRCESRIMDYVIDIFGTDCRIIPVDEKHFDVSIKGSTQGILLFAQQYIDGAEILEPQSLREEMASLLSRKARQYKK